MKVASHLPILRPGTAGMLDLIAEETPVALQYNGISHAVMLATPADLEDLVLGFSLSEGIVDQAADIFDIDIQPADEGLTLAIKIAGAPFWRLKEIRRSMAGRTGCGLCGKESLTHVMRDLPPVASGGKIPITALYEGLRRLPSEQHLQRATGAVHAACQVDAFGNIDFVREDIGRHNALDKSIGAIVRSGGQREAAMIVTSRASFEMVQKVAACGFGLLAALSAPTASAVRLAERLNITLVGFLRGEACVVYSHPQRLQGEQL